MAKITYSQQPNAPADEVLLPEEDLLAFTDLEDRDAIKTPTNPRRQVEEMALQLLAGILFEDNFEFDTISISKSQLALLIGQAIDWQTRGDTTQALTTYQKILASGFKHPAVIFVIATLLLKQGDYNQAITSFNQAKTERNYLQGINFGLGECYKAQKDINQALRHFVEVLKVIDLRNVHNEGTEELNQLYHDLVNNYITTADEKKSTQFVESLIKFLSSPNYEQKISEARRRLGTGDSTSVSAWIEFLEAPNTEIILSAMTSTGEYMRQNMLMTAVETCYRAIQQAPFYLPLHLRLAEIYMKQEAIENSIKKYLAVAEVYYVRGNFKQVTGIYQKVLKVAPMDVTVRSKLVDLYINQNNYEAALEQNQILADAYYQIAQIDRALETYQASLNVAAKSANPVRWQVDILHHLGDIYAQRVDWGNAAKIYGQLVTLSPEDEKAMLALVDLYFKLGRGSQALQILDRTIGLFIKHNKQARIIEFLKDMTQLRPHELPLHDKLAALYGHLGMRLEAIAQYNIMADMQLEAGLRDDAARTIQRIIDLNPNDVSKYRQLLAQIKGGI